MILNGFWGNKNLEVWERCSTFALAFEKQRHLKAHRRALRCGAKASKEKAGKLSKKKFEKVLVERKILHNFAKLSAAEKATRKENLEIIAIDKK